MSNFDERSGVVICQTPWGSWYQTIDEVFLEIVVNEGTRAKDISCNITSHSISLIVDKKTIIKGQLAGGINSEESLWTLEDKKMVRIVLVKSNREAKNCWKSLLTDEYACDPSVFDQMEKKMTLERFQRENPGFDFSGADITGNYQKGGPELS